MPTADTGPDVRRTKIVSIVGDAKFLWSIMGCVVNWLRHLLSGPFPRSAMLKRAWIRLLQFMTAISIETLSS